MKRLSIATSTGYCIVITLSVLVAMKGPEQGGKWAEGSESPEQREKKVLAERLADLARDIKYRVTEANFIAGEQGAETLTDFIDESVRVLLRGLFELTSADEETQHLTLQAMGVKSPQNSHLKPRLDDPPIGGGSHVIPDLEGNWPPTKRSS